MEAVGREFGRRHVTAEHPCRCGFGQQLRDQRGELLVRVANVLAAVNQGGEIGIVMFVTDLRVCLENGATPRPGIAWLVLHSAQMLEVMRDLLIVPCKQDRFDILEVLVQGRAADAGLVRDL